MTRPLKIISGGQTGADQGGLQAAIDLGIETGGTAPKGYRTEVGPNLLLRDLYHLVESPYSAYPPRTKANADEADGTVWSGSIGSPGYWCTKKAAINKPWIENPSPEVLRDWVTGNKILVLNVAGNRESTNPGIFAKTRKLIVEAFEVKCSP